MGSRSFRAEWVMGLAGIVSCGDAFGTTDDAVPLPPRSFDAAAEASEEDTYLPGLPQDAGPEDAGSDARVFLGCNGALDCERVVFATTKDYGGAFGGIAEADQRCQSHADSSQSPRVKGRKFQAWVSTAASPVVSRFPQGTRAYVRPDGLKVADDWADLTDSSLDVGIGLNEDGDNPGGSGRVWTGTNNNGTAAPQNCGEWKNTQLGGLRGNLGGSAGGWSASENDGCTNPGHLYCFEF